MAVTGTTVAAAATMMAALAAIFLSFVLCFYIFLCAKRSRGGGGAPPPPPGSGVVAHLRFLLCGVGDGRAAAAGDGPALWYYDGGLDDASMASLPRREVAKGEAVHCAVCITELAAGETARVLPRCGHAFHVDCVDMWLKSHSTCPLCRCPAVDAPPLPPAPVRAPEADEESPNFPTNVLFFGSQDDVSTGGGAQSPASTPPPPPPPSAPAPSSQAPPPAGTHGLRRLLGCGGESRPPRQQQEVDAVRQDIEMGLSSGGENCAPRQPKLAGSS
uniref:Uncharacterized protein n=1 Tax=Avena sativa TaxID=4498 RepID=A0ACD5Z039_AVESA